MPLKLKPTPLSAICEMVRAAAPELLRVSESVFLDPGCTEPKFKTLVANLSGPQVQMSSNWVSNTAGALQFVCCRSNGIAYWNLVHFFKPKLKPKPKRPHSSPVAVADGDPSSLVLLAVGFTGLLVAAVFARTKLRT